MTRISQGTLALSGDGSISASSGVHNNSVFDVSGTTSSTPSIQALDGSGATVLGNNTLVLTNANSGFGNVYSGVMSGAGGLTVNGGTQTLTGNNSYTGDTTVASNAGLGLQGKIASALVNAGTTDVKGGSVGGKTTNTGTLTAENGTLADIANNAGQATLTNSTAGAVTNAQDATFTATGGTLASAGNAGTMTLGSQNTVSGDVTNSGSLTLDGNTINGTLAAQSGSFAVTGNNAQAGALSGNGNGTLDGTLALNNAKGSYAGVMSGAGGLTVNGGTQTLTGNNSYTGDTTVASNAGLGLQGKIASALVNAGTTDVKGGSVGGKTTNTGTLTAENGTLADIANNAGQATLTNSTAGAVTNAQDATFTATGGTLASAGNAGTMTLGSQNTVSGDVTNSGSLTLDGNTINGTLAAQSGSFAVTGNNAQAGALSGNGNGTLGGTLALNNAKGSYAGVMSGAGGLTVNGGTQTLTGNNSYTGLTAIGSNASLALGDGGTGGLASGTSAFHNDGVLNVNHSDAVTIGQVISGTGSLNQNGSGLTVLTGSNSYTGATDVSTGALQVDGDQSGATGATSVASGAQLGGAGTIGGNVSIADNGILSPGDGTHGVGTLTINGNLTLANNAIQNWDLGQAYAEGGQYNDLVRIKGNMTFGGTLNVTGVANGTSVVPIDSKNGLGRGVYRIYTYDGALSGAANGKLGSVDTASGTSLALQTSINHQINLIVSDGTLTYWDGGSAASRGADGATGNNAVNGGDGTWTAVNGAGDNNWTNSGGTKNEPWSSGQFAIFEGQAGTVTVSNHDANGTPANVTFSGMQFANNDGGVYKVTGDDLYATTGTTTIRVGDGTTDGSAITANLDTVINDSNVSGGTSLVKSDAGTLIITKDQTYIGATTIDGGTLQLGNGGTGGRIGSSSAIHNKGILAIDHSDAVGIAQVIDGTGSLVQSGSGTTTLTGVNSYTGSTAISSGTLALSGDGSISASSGVHNNSVFDVSGTTSSTPSIQALDGSGATVLGNNTLVLTNANSGFGNVYSGVMSGAGGLTVNGGTQTLTGNNSYTGDTTVASNAGLGLQGKIASALVNAGTTDVKGGSVGGKTTNTGTLTAENGTLADIANNAGQATLTNSTAGAVTNAQDATFTATGGTLASAGNAGTMTLGSQNTVSGDVTNSGSLTLDGNTINGTLAAQSGSFAVTGNNAQAGALSGNGNGTLDGTLALNNAKGSYAGVMSGAGGLTVNGGTQTLTGNNSYTGDTTVASNAGLGLQGKIASALVNAGTTDVKGGSVGGKTTNTGTLTAENGTLADIANNAGQATLTNSTAGAVTNAQDATFTATGGTLASAGNAGTMTLGSQNTVSGDVTNSGSLTLDGNTINGTLAAQSGSFAVTGNNAQAGALSGNGNGTLDGTLALNNAKGSYAGVMSGAGGLTVNGGTQTLTGNNSYTGLTAIGSNASLALGDGGTGGLASGTSAFHNDGVLNVNHSDAVTIGQVISGTGSLNQNGSGLTVLTGSNSYTGATDVSTGALQVDGDQSGATGATSVASGAQLGGAGTIGGNVSIADNGILSPGDGTHGVGTLTINGNLTLANNAIQNWDLGQAYAEGGQYNDLVRIKGNMTFGGTLNVTGVANGTSVVPIDSKNGLGRGVYRIYTYDGALSGAANGKLGSVDTASGTSLALQTSINHQINLIVSDGTLSFWDGGKPNDSAVNGAHGNGTVDGGDGIWNTQNSNWTTPAGTTNGAAEPGQFAIFEGQAGTVTVSNHDANGTPANVTFSGMQFANNDGGVYKITGDDLYATTGTTTIRVGDGTTDGSAITANLDTVINDSNVSGGTSLVKSDAGTLIITKDQTYRGDTTISGGTLQLGDGGTGGHIDSSPAIHNNGRLVVDHADSVNLAQRIDGTGALIQAGTGTTTLGNNNSYTGGTALTNGGLQGATTSFGSGDISVGQNANLIIAQQSDGDFENTVLGNGQITKQGGGSVAFDRNNTKFNGNVDVLAGELAVNGAMTSATFAARDGGILSGTGALGTTTISSGGVLSPAGSGLIGTMTINRNLTMEPGSTLYMDAASQSTGSSVTEQGKTYERLASDLVNVQGSVNLNGGTVAFNASTGSVLNRNQAYRLIQSTDGISGRFDQLSSNIGNQYLFLSPSLTYSGNAVDLLLNRNGNSFSVVGNARNELAAGVALDNLPENNPVVQVLAGLDKNDARKALNAVSGEIHASMRSALIEDAYLAREAVTDRLDSADCDGVDNSGVMRTAATRRGSLKGQCYSDRLVLWTQAYGSLGKNYGNGNAAGMNHTNAGFLMGADTPVFETARVGGVFGYSNSTFNVSDGRASSGHSNNITVGGYAGNHWGKLNLRLGATYTWNMLNTSRTVAFNGYQGSRLGASYLGGTSQAFGEIGYKIKTRATTVEPFAGVAYVNVHTNSFREKSGSDALAGQSMTTGMTYSTFGIRASATYQAGRTLLTPRFMAGYRHAFGLTTPTARLNFAGVSDANMDVAGTPIAADVAVINAGFGIKATDRITLGIYYTGQYGVQAIDNGAKANISLSF